MRERNAVTRFAACLLLLAACSNDTGSGPGGETTRHAIKAGVLANSALTEASGLAHSNKQDDLIWAINDGGSPATLYAVGYDGSDLGEVRMSDLQNVDWEDLASFEYDGKSMLLIADVGDNLGSRSHVTLFIVDEPDPRQQAGALSWQISLRFPDGPRDVEAVTVDSQEGLVYLLAKRTIPAELYSVPLHPADEDETAVVTAKYLGTVASLPQPTERDRKRALLEMNWHWQPTAMEFSRDGNVAVILTYRAAYLYSRQDNEPWLDTLQRTPHVFALGSIKEAEAVTLAGNSIFVTVEAKRAPLYRINPDH